MPTTLRLNFPGHNNIALAARLELPTSTPKYYAIFCHCFTCTKDILVAYRISKQLAQFGIATLRFDFAGLGESEGEFAETNFSTGVEDLLAAAEYLKQAYQAPQLLIGHSLGGTTALACAQQIASVQAVVTIASPSQPAHVLHHFGDALTELTAGKASSIMVAGHRYAVNPQLLDDIQQYDMQARLAELDKPVLIFRVTDDAIIEPENAEQIQAWTHAVSELVELANSDHLLSDKATVKSVAEKISAFIQ